MAKGRSRLVQAQKAAKKQHHQPKKQKIDDTTSKPTKPKAPPPKAHLAPIIPFSPSDAILLIGEGDLSFAASLATHHACTHLTATVFEPSRAALLEKYPHAEANLTALETATPPARVLFNIDARRMTPLLKPKPSNPNANPKYKPKHPQQVGAMDRIMFNFPHIGGKSTDVNRQVRANQELLVDFFRRALPSLAPHGKMIVTLFEGEPYTLWNVKDLARHAGLAVERSFRFRAETYPGYRHARTLGVVRTRKGEVSESGWKGEERAARSYVFVRKEDAPKPGARKRKAGEESSGNESESESEGEGDWGGVSEDEDKDAEGGEEEEEEEDEGGDGKGGDENGDEDGNDIHKGDD